MKGFEKLSITDTPAGAVLPVKAVPASSRDRIVGMLGDRLKVTVSAAPEKGKANDAIAQLLAEALGVPPRSVSLRSGPTRPLKEFLIAGLSAAEIRLRLAGL
jgi:uncharacterized protein